MKLTAAAAPFVVGWLTAASATHAKRSSKSPGCGTSHASDGISKTQSLLSGGQNRTFSLNIPEGYAADDAYPVVFGFHGAPGTGLFFEIDTGMSAVTRGGRALGKMIAVYPDGVNGTWGRPDVNGGEALERDLTFIHDLLGSLREGYCVDDARVYATGHSMGGGMVNNLACNATVGGAFAAFAPVAGAFYGEEEREAEGGRWACAPARNAPMLSIHGREDETVPYDGREGEERELPAVVDWFRHWIRRYKGEKGSPMSIDNGTSVVWRWGDDNSTEPILTHVEVSKWNHSWPSTEPNFSMAVANDEDAPFDATAKIQAFFGDQRLSEAALEENAKRKGGGEKDGDGQKDNEAGGEEKDAEDPDGSGGVLLRPVHAVLWPAALAVAGALA